MNVHTNPKLEERKRTACTTPAGDSGSEGGCSTASLQLKIHLFVTRQADQLKQSDALHLTNSDTCTHKITEGNDHQLSPAPSSSSSSSPSMGENENAPIATGGNDHRLHGHTDDLANNKQCTLQDQRNCPGSPPSPFLCPSGTKKFNQVDPKNLEEQLNNCHHREADPPPLECTFGRPNFLSIFKSSDMGQCSTFPSSSTSTCCSLDTANGSMSMNKCHMHTVGVFVCGNSSVRKSVKQCIFRVNLERGRKQFLYHSESFC